MWEKHAMSPFDMSLVSLPPVVPLTLLALYARHYALYAVSVSLNEQHIPVCSL